MIRSSAFKMSLAALLACAAAAAPAAPDASPVREPEEQVLYSQLDSLTGESIVSQNFEPQFDAYDNQAADDFVVPQGERWTLRKVEVAGRYYDGAGPANSKNVTIYESSFGLPGRVIASFDRIAGGDDGTGNFGVKLPTPVKLKPGHYWISVQVNMHFVPKGEWFWLLRTPKVGRGAVWRNPGESWYACPDYTPAPHCGWTQGGLAFQLLGTSSTR